MFSFFGALLSFILSLHFGRVMSVSCYWLHFCFFARVLNCKVVKNHRYSTTSCTRFIQQKEQYISFTSLSEWYPLCLTLTFTRSLKRCRKPSVKRWNFTHDERWKRQNKYTRLELKYYCWVALRQVFIFILKWIVYAAFISCGLIWHLQFRGRDRENFLMTPLGQLKFEGSVLFKG